MRFIDRSRCRSYKDKGQDHDVVGLYDDGSRLSKEACKIAEDNNLGVVKLSENEYKIIRESGLGDSRFRDVYDSLADVDAALKKSLGRT